MNILLNYQYQHYPFTTASYFEMAIKESKDHELFRNDSYNPEDIDLVINVEPVDDIIKIDGVPSVYYEIDNHVIRGADRHFYDKVDLILLAQNNFKSFYEDYKTAYLPLACWPKLHKRYPEEEQIYDIGLLGNDTYPYRKMLLEMLEKEFKVLRGQADPGEPYSRKLNQCKMLFNCSMDKDVNMRFYEAISCGRLLLTDHLEAQDDIAIEGVHYVAFKDQYDLIEKVRYYLEHEGERGNIAKQGMEHIQENHNYNIRLDELLEIIKNHGLFKNEK